MATAQEIIEAAKNRQAAAAAVEQTGSQSAPEAATQAVASSAMNSSSVNLSSTIPQSTQAVAQPPVELSKDEVVAARMRTKGHEFQHVYAGAGTIMDNGKRLTFGGAPGGNGRYVTADEEEVEFLKKLANTPGSQITEIFRDADGREVARGAESSLAQDLTQARADAARNTELDTDPAVNTARNNLGNAIKLNG